VGIGDIHDLFLDVPNSPFPKQPSDAVEQRRQSATITRKLRMLRAHGLIQKIPKTHRYQLCPHGRDIINALLIARQTSIAKLAA